MNLFVLKKILVKKGKTTIIQLHSKNKNAIDTPFIILIPPPSLCNFFYTQTCNSNWTQQLFLSLLTLVKPTDSLLFIFFVRLFQSINVSIFFDSSSIQYSFEIIFFFSYRFCALTLFFWELLSYLKTTFNILFYLKTEKIEKKKILYLLTLDIQSKY